MNNWSVKYRVEKLRLTTELRILVGFGGPGDMELSSCYKILSLEQTHRPSDEAIVGTKQRVRRRIPIRREMIDFLWQAHCTRAFAPPSSLI